MTLHHNKSTLTLDFFPEGKEGLSRQQLLHPQVLSVLFKSRHGKNIPLKNLLLPKVILVSIVGLYGYPH
jgi:hypothetical protein